jgi:putative membrane protein insertion efficiency factor
VARGASLRPGPAATILVWMIRGYKLLLSPLFAGSCRFEPSCSRYAAQAIERYGALRGARLAAGRLMRCHPFCRAGYDPVPDLDS